MDHISQRISNLKALNEEDDDKFLLEANQIIEELEKEEKKLPELTLNKEPILGIIKKLKDLNVGNEYIVPIETELANLEAQHDQLKNAPKEKEDKKSGKKKRDF